MKTYTITVHQFLKAQYMYFNTQVYMYIISKQIHVHIAVAHFNVYLFKLGLPIFFSFIHEVDAMRESGYNPCCSSLKGQSLSSKINLIEVDGSNTTRRRRPSVMTGLKDKRIAPRATMVFSCHGRVMSTSREVPVHGKSVACLDERGGGAGVGIVGLGRGLVSIVVFVTEVVY